MKKELKKRFAVISLMFGMLIGCTFVSEAKLISTEEQAYRNQVLKVTGIIDTDENADAASTRAEFAKMLVQASAQKNLIGTITVSAANDVPASNLYAVYIRTALLNNWMRSRIGGSFDPEGGVTLTDAAKAAMTMLGYTDQDFSGDVNNMRIAKFCSLGLNDGVSVTGAYDVLTKKDARNVVYNILKTNSKNSNNIYGSAINLSLSSDGSINATNVLDDSLVGPILITSYDNIQANLPFNISEGTFYYNGSKTSYYQNQQLLYYTSQIQNCGWLIMYYNTDSKTVFAYGQDTGNSAYHCIRGTVNGVNYEDDNIVSPSQVIVDGTVYNLGTTDAKFMFSINGTVEVGDQVVLICKKSTTTDYNGSDVSSYYVTGVVMYRKKGN